MPEKYTPLDWLLTVGCALLIVTFIVLGLMYKWAKFKFFMGW